MKNLLQIERIGVVGAIAVTLTLLLVSPVAAQHWESSDDIPVESTDEPQPDDDDDDEAAEDRQDEAAAPQPGISVDDPAPRPAVEADEQQAESAEDAQEQPAASPSGPPETREEIIAHERAIEQRQEIRESTRRQLQTESDSVHIYQLAEEMIDELIADVSELNARALAPAAMREMTLTPNLSDQFGQFVESTLVTALATHTDVSVRRCVACSAMRSRVDGDDWVVTRGLVHHEDLRDEANRLGANVFLDTRFSYYPGANVVAMQVEFFRADDGAVVWSETYRSDATTAAILRTGDRVESREERVSELERKLDARPYYGYQVNIGVGHIPYDDPEAGFGGIMLGLRLYEKFGSNRQYLYGIGADSFANFRSDGILGSFVYGVLQAEIREQNLNRPTIRTGPAIGGFFAGTEGNSFVGEWTLDAVFQFRLGAGASVFYFVPTEFANRDLGGLGAKGRVTFTW